MLYAQTTDELSSIRHGNDKFYQSEKYREQAMSLLEKGGNVNERKAGDLLKKSAEGYQSAEVQYRKALSANKNYDKANYNLGTALYRQERYDEAAQYFKGVAEQPSADAKLRAKAYHNLGNSLMKQEKYSESVNAFKNSLKLDPSDLDTKYNLEYAKQKLKQQQQQQQQNQQNQDQQNQQNQQNQGGQGDDNKDKQDKQNQDKNQNNGNQDKQDNQNQQDKQNSDNQQNKDKKENGESAADKQKRQEEKRQLDALQQNERNTQQKVKAQEMRQGAKVHQEKDW